MGGTYTSSAGLTAIVLLLHLGCACEGAAAGGDEDATKDAIAAVKLYNRDMESAKKLDAHRQALFEADRSKDREKARTEELSSGGALMGGKKEPAWKVALEERERKSREQKRAWLKAFQHARAAMLSDDDGKDKGGRLQSLAHLPHKAASVPAVAAAAAAAAVHDAAIASGVDKAEGDGHSKHAATEGGGDSASQEQHASVSSEHASTENGKKDSVEERAADIVKEAVNSAVEMALHDTVAPKAGATSASAVTATLGGHISAARAAPRARGAPRTAPDPVADQSLIDYAQRWKRHVAELKILHKVEHETLERTSSLAEVTKKQLNEEQSAVTRAQKGVSEARGAFLEASQKWVKVEDMGGEGAAKAKALLDDKRAGLAAAVRKQWEAEKGLKVADGTK